MVDPLKIAEGITIPISELQLTAVRASGAGGQNVNKVATAVHLRFDSAGSKALPDTIKARLLDLDDQRITPEGVIIIKAQEHRTQERNRRAAIDRLCRLLKSVLVETKPRKPTRPSKTTLRKRLNQKRRRGDLKQTRCKVTDD